MHWSLATHVSDTHALLTIAETFSLFSPPPPPPIIAAEQNCAVQTLIICFSNVPCGFACNGDSKFLMPA